MRSRSPNWSLIRGEWLQLKRDLSLRYLGTDKKRVSLLSRARRRSLCENIVGIGLGEKFANSTGQKEMCFRFLVRHKYAEKWISQGNRIPDHFDGLITDVVEVGMPCGIAPMTGRTHAAHGAIQPGCSISFAAGSPADRTAGSIAAIVTDGTDHFILSACHVIADEGRVPIGTPVLHPGSLDNPAPSPIATLERFVPLTNPGRNQVDCAIARISPGIPWSATVPGFGNINGDSSAYARQLVTKIGRTTGRTDGIVSNLLQDVRVQLRHQQYWMEDQIETTGLISSFAEPGDSGSLVLDTTTRSAVGIVCARAGSFVYVSPISLILESLGVRLV